ncbi:CotH kinase family protein [uncultured Fibrobacter sp.]|uniref:CotH kinase family protein n=1 Tax=uncultured Fibrobacter sp. TaxID=261512 RepID=UPI0025CCB7C8|nr:CotH kinase family protein [uncultured Fibrobacter sp.]
MREHFRQCILPVAVAVLLCFGCCVVGCQNETTDPSPDYLPLDDSEYPYADLPRIVIETENFSGIRDRETIHPSFLQIYGESGPESEVLELTVHGRGNSSFKMPKYGLKLEFKDKLALLGMPASRDWVLVANYGDKAHLRNYMAMRLSEWLGMPYTPRCRFVELYLNRRYMGLYLLMESVKVAKERVNIAENDTSFLFEKEGEKKIDSPFFRSCTGEPFHVRSPKNVSQESMELLRTHLCDFERCLQRACTIDSGAVAEWVDMDDFMPYYWVQEFSKNEDANFGRSIFMTWQKGGKIHFGPIWDFDISFGNESYERNRGFDGWYIRKYRWFGSMFRSPEVKEEARLYWMEHRETIHALADSVPLYRAIIEKAVKNEYRRWPIITNTENWALKDPYESYDEAISVMMDWMERRFQWIDAELNGGS